MATYIVCRPLPLGDTVLHTGAEVDDAGFRNTRKLVAQRYLRPLTAEEVVQRAAQSKPAKEARDANR